MVESDIWKHGRLGSIGNSILKGGNCISHQVYWLYWIQWNFWGTALDNRGEENIRVKKRGVIILLPFLVKGTCVLWINKRDFKCFHKNCVSLYKAYYQENRSWFQTFGKYKYHDFLTHFFFFPILFLILLPLLKNQ